jgi:hypothetical protein
MPWIDFYPRPGQARGIQVDINPDRIGLRYPVELGLIGEVRATLQGLLPRLQRKTDRGFLSEAQNRTQDWNALLDRIENAPHLPLRPQMVIRALSDLLADDAVITLDCGANTHFAARHLRLRAGQRLISPGMLDTMAPGLPFAIAGQLACPDRSDGGHRRGRRLCHADGGADHRGEVRPARQGADPQQQPTRSSRFRAARSRLRSIRLRLVADRLRWLCPGLRGRRVPLRNTPGNSTGNLVGASFA